MRTLLLAFLASSLPAQVVTLHNPTPWPLLGWLPAQTTLVTPSLTGFDPLTIASYYAGTQQEPGNATVWVRAFIPAGGTEVVDIGACVPSIQPVGALPDWTAEYGGWFEVDGTVLNYQVVERDGPWWLMRGLRTIHPNVAMVCSIRWDRSQDYMAQIETSVVYIAASQSQPLLVLPNAVKATWGTAELWNGVDATADTDPFVPAGLQLRHLEPVQLQTTAVWMNKASTLGQNTARALHSRAPWTIAVP
jgi:hypothetical protein